MSKQNWPTFSESMQYSVQYNQERIEIANWDYFEQIYNNYRSSEPQKEKIPKILHQIWLGRPIPNIEKNRCQAIQNNLPNDWTYKLWTDTCVDKIKDEFTNYNLFKQTNNYGQKSDILRNFILWKYGGVYCDTDFIFVKSFDPILDLDFFCGLTYDRNPIVMNSVIGSSPGNDLISECQNYDKTIDCTDSMKIIDTTGPYFLTRKFLKVKMKNAVAFPNSFFYPYPNCDRCKKHGNDYNLYIKNETFCCHLWACSWI